MSQARGWELREDRVRTTGAVGDVLTTGPSSLTKGILPTTPPNHGCSSEICLNLVYVKT